MTTKLGSSDKRPGTADAPPRDCRFYAGEMAMSTFVLTAAFYGIFSINKWSFSIFLTLQGGFPGACACCCGQEYGLREETSTLSVCLYCGAHRLSCCFCCSGPSVWFTAAMSCSQHNG